MVGYFSFFFRYRLSEILTFYVTLNVSTNKEVHLYTAGGDLKKCRQLCTMQQMGFAAGYWRRTISFLYLSSLCASHVLYLFDGVTSVVFRVAST